jgi:hypothetical protein
MFGLSGKKANCDQTEDTGTDVDGKAGSYGKNAGSYGRSQKLKVES